VPEEEEEGEGEGEVGDELRVGGGHAVAFSVHLYNRSNVSDPINSSIGIGETYVSVALP